MSSSSIEGHLVSAQIYLAVSLFCRSNCKHRHLLSTSCVTVVILGPFLFNPHSRSVIRYSYFLHLENERIGFRVWDISLRASVSNWRLTYVPQRIMKWFFHPGHASRSRGQLNKPHIRDGGNQRFWYSVWHWVCSSDEFRRSSKESDEMKTSEPLTYIHRAWRPNSPPLSFCRSLTALASDLVLWKPSN